MRGLFLHHHRYRVEASQSHGYFLLVLYFLFNVYVILDAIPATNVPGPSGI